ncbi:hypothetical protein HB162lentus_01800 [Mammaliicoccus lentus]
MTIIFGIIFFVGWAFGALVVAGHILDAIDEGDKVKMWLEVAMLTLGTMVFIFLFNFFRALFVPTYYWYY